MRKEEITFYALYERAKNQASPGQLFIEKIGRITQRSPTTVRMWLSGLQTPDSKVQQIIADEFNVEVDGLFAPSNTNKRKRNDNSN